MQSTKNTFDKPATGFILLRDKLRYEIKAIAQTTPTQLKVTLHATRLNSPLPPVLSTLDLYSHRSRQAFAELCAKGLGVDAAIVLHDLQTLVEPAEQHCASVTTANAPTVIELTDSARAEALQFLTAPNLMERIVADMQSCGYVGEAIIRANSHLASGDE